MSRRKEQPSAGGLLHRLAAAVQGKYAGTREIVVSKGWCTPARPIVEGTLRTYGVVIVDYSETIEELPIVGPFRISARVRVRKTQAEWAEYNLLRTGKLKLRSRPVNQRNREWARRHRGKMPRPWAEYTGQWREGGKCAKGGDQ